MDRDLQDYEVVLDVECRMSEEDILSDSYGEHLEGEDLYLELDGNDRPTGYLRLRNARATYRVKAKNPWEARNKAKALFLADNFGVFQMRSARLKSVRQDNTYWYEKDLWKVAKAAGEEYSMLQITA